MSISDSSTIPVNVLVPGDFGGIGSEGGTRLVASNLVNDLRKLKNGVLPSTVWAAVCTGMSVIDQLHLVSSPSLPWNLHRTLHDSKVQFQDSLHSDSYHANEADTLPDGIPEQFASREPPDARCRAGG